MLFQSVKHRILFILGIFFLGNCSPFPQEFIDISGEWDYVWGRDMGVSKNPLQEFKWQTGNLPGEVSGREQDIFLLVRRTLPENNPNIRDPAMYLHIVLEDFKVFLDGREIYSFGSMDNHSLRIASFTNPHVISLPLDYSGKELRIYFHSTYYQFIGVDHFIFIANQGDIKEAMLLYDFPRYLLTCIYLLIALGALFFYFLSPKNMIFLYYSALVLFNSGLTLTGNYLSIYFFDNKSLPPFIYNLNLYFLPLTFFWFLGEVYKKNHSLGFLIGKVVYSIVPFVFLVLFVTDVSSFLNNEPYFDLMLIPGLGYFLYVIGRESWEGDMDSKILFLGMVVVSGFTIHDVLKDLGVFNSTVVLYWYGIFFFLLSQGSILFRRLYNVQKNYELKENELMVAQKIQNTLLPQIPSRLGDWELVSFYSPMKEVGGDFYDFVQDEEGNFGIIILDVSGHGVGASIIASMAKISFSNSSASMSNPGELLKEMNRSLCGKIGDNFATGFYIYGNSHQSTICFSSAGHPSSFLVSHINNDVLEFRTKSKPIGIFKDYDYSSSYIYLNEGDILFLYTDGVTELQSPEGEEIGETRVKEILLKNSLFDLNMIKTALIREFQLWTGSPNFSKEDDLSFLLLRYKSNF